MGYVTTNEVARTKRLDNTLAWLSQHPDRWFTLFDRVPSIQQRQVIDQIAYEKQLSIRYGRDHPDFLGQYAVGSGQGTGKSATVGSVMCWNTGQQPMTVSVLTAPTMANISQGVLADLRVAAFEGHPLLKQILHFYHDRIRFFNVNEWELRGRTASTDVGLAGVHRRHLGICIDESSGIDDMVVQTYQGTLTNEYPLLLLTGNPTKATGRFHDILYTNRFAGQWRRYIWSSLDSPFANAERDKQLIREYGYNSDVVRVRVHGLPPSGNRDSVIPGAWVEWSMQSSDLEAVSGVASYAHLMPLPDYGFPVQIGLDFARSDTGDKSSIAVRVNRKLTIYSFRGVEPLDLIAKAFRIQKDLGVDNDQVLYVADADGMGQGVMVAFQRNEKNYYEFHTSSDSVTGEYANLMTQAWFDLKKLLRPTDLRTGTGCQLQVDRNDELQEQLRSRRFFLDDSNRYKLEPKKKHIADYGYSPDQGDAAAYACCRINMESDYFFDSDSGSDESAFDDGISLKFAA